MSRKLGLWLMLCVFALSDVALQAQQATEGAHPPPKVLVIVREYLKPGKAGSAHDRTEGAFPAAFRAAKWPQQYLAMDSLTGAPRSLFFVGYPSFEAWQTDSLNTQKNASLSAALDKATIADGEMLNSIETSVFVLREDMSLNAPVDIPHMRYMEISMFHVRSGHQADWQALVKIYQDAYKSIPDAHWAVYQSNYGQLGDGTYLVITPMKSASEVDKGFGDSKKAMDAMGPEGTKRLSDLGGAAIESSQTNLFMFNPRLSYVGEEWQKADPFWKTQSAAPMKKAEPKPKQ
jgi:hypothetical protein